MRDFVRSIPRAQCISEGVVEKRENFIEGIDHWIEPVTKSAIEPWAAHRVSTCSTRGNGYDHTN